MPPPRVTKVSPPDRKTLEVWDDTHVWHPFTPHSVYRDEAPLMVAAAEGHELIDVDGLVIILAMPPDRLHQRGPEVGRSQI